LSAQPRRLLALLDGELAAELADELALALGVERHLAGDEHEVAAAHRRHVVGGGAAAGGSVMPSSASRASIFRTWIPSCDVK
jgi:hypothetical protein